MCVCVRVFANTSEALVFGQVHLIFDENTELIPGCNITFFHDLRSKVKFTTMVTTRSPSSVNEKKINFIVYTSDMALFKACHV